MLPSDKKLKSLIRKIKTNVEKKHAQKVENKKERVIELTEEDIASSNLFNEMKKLPFVE